MANLTKLLVGICHGRWWFQVFFVFFCDPLGGRFLQSDKHMICFISGVYPPAFVGCVVTLSGWLISPALALSVGVVQNNIIIYTPGSSNIAGCKTGAPDWVDSMYFLYKKRGCHSSHRYVIVDPRGYPWQFGKVIPWWWMISRFSSFTLSFLGRPYLMEKV